MLIWSNRLPPDSLRLSIDRIRPRMRPPHAALDA